MHLTMGNGVVTEHQLYIPGVMLGGLQEWVLQNAHLGSFSGVGNSLDSCLSVVNIHDELTDD